MVLLIAKFNGNIPAANILNIFETTRIFTKKKLSEECGSSDTSYRWNSTGFLFLFNYFLFSIVASRIFSLTGNKNSLNWFYFSS